MIKKTKEFIERLVDKYIIGESFTDDELIDCYYEENKKYIACYNSSGDAFMEEYNSFNLMLIDYYGLEDFIEKEQYYERGERL